MAFQQYFVQEWNRITTSATSAKLSTCFDCNICLELACNPVVTLCGHLYCWPCIYKWMITQTASLPSGQLPRCPVCKAETSIRTVVPLYGRGQLLSDPDPDMKEEIMIIPPRPPGLQGLPDSFSPGGQQTPQDMHNNPRLSDYRLYSEPRLSSTHVVVPPAVSHPMVGMLGEMVYAGVFGNSAGMYANPNSYRSAGSSTPRLRRRHLEAEKSLNRVSIFLFCCFLVCLLLF